MEKFLLFAFLRYDSVGGWNDFVGSYTTMEEAMRQVSGNEIDFRQIVDRDTQKVIWEACPLERAS